MATDAQSLLAAAKCYECNAANPYSMQMIQVALLRQILVSLDSSIDVSPQALLQSASCYQCYAANDYMLKMIELALLRQLVIFTGG